VPDGRGAHLTTQQAIDLIDREYIRNYKYEILLIGILTVSAFLNLWNLWNLGFTNAFYAAAVKSALVNPAAGLFNSFDPAGFVTVDKPPVGLWVQALFAAVLGFRGWVLVLPQALAGIGSVALVYFIVARPFGKPAGLVAALALAVTPILVAVSRNGTMDSQLIFVLLLAVWAVQKAARERSLPWLLVSVVLVGIAFNIKMIQAFVVVPAIHLVYLVGTTDFFWKKRVLHVGIAVMVLLAVSLSWAVAVDMVPAGERPYIGGSGDNTVLGLIINYNGLERLGLEGRGAGFPGGGAGEMRAGDIRAGDLPAATAPRDTGAGQYREAAATRGGITSAVGGMANEDGTPGITRFFGPALAGQFSWLLPLALIGLLAWVRKPLSWSWKGLEDAGLFGERGLVIIAMLLWLVPGLLFFSYSNAFAHTYYIATIAPPLAALVGIGAFALYHGYLSDGWKGWILPGAVLVTGLLQALFLSYNAAWSGLLLPLVLIGALVCTGILVWLRLKDPVVSMNHRHYMVLIALAFLFVAPFAWSCTPFLYGSNGGVAGPPQAGRIAGMDGAAGYLTGMDRAGFGQNLTGRERLAGAGYAGGFAGAGAFAPAAGGTSVATTRLADYLLPNTTNNTWILATPSSQSAAGLIIQTGKPVMAIGGFSGSDRILNLTSLEALIQEGKIRYFLTGGAGGGGIGGGAAGGNSALFGWVTTHCTPVDLSPGNGTENQTGSAGAGTASVLYDCAGAAVYA